ncbi:hypothetical protein NRP93_003171 [Clostridium botulinum]|nr:hypothetical protein [Clostridium botulinum]
MSIYVGGDTTELEYNFFGKVAGSMTECPMKCYAANSETLLLPTSLAWIEIAQNQYDMLKNNDGVPVSSTSNTQGEKTQLLIEVDLNRLCNSLYGGSNTTLKKNVKSIQLSAVVRGQGENGGVSGYLSKHYLYNHYINQYTEWGENATSSLITSSNEVNVMGTSNSFITQENKVYMLVVSDYPADSKISSTLYLDYVSISLKLTRQPDVIPPIDIDLKDEWSILIKGFSPSWDNNNAPNPYPRILEIKDKLIVSYRKDKKVFYFQDLQTNTLTALPEFSFKRFQNINFLIVQNKDKKIIFYAYENGGTIKKISDLSNPITGVNSLYILQSIGNGRNGDAFIDKIQLLNQAVTDEEAEIILKGRNDIDLGNNYYNKLVEIYKNPNLVPNFNNNSWYIHPNATVNLDGTILTLNATSNYQGSSCILPVLPNNRYKVEVEIEDSSKLAHIAIAQKYNNITISTARVYDNSGIYNGEFIIQDKINAIALVCQNTGVGTFKFKKLKLIRLD